MPIGECAEGKKSTADSWELGASLTKELTSYARSHEEMGGPQLSSKNRGATLNDSEKLDELHL